MQVETGALDVLEACERALSVASKRRPAGVNCVAECLLVQWWLRRDCGGKACGRGEAVKAGG